MIGLMAATVASVFMTGTDLYSNCTGSTSAQIDCLGYVSGVLDVTNDMETDGAIEAKFCTPEGIKRGQAMAVVVKYLRDNPSLRAASASKLVVMAMIKEFPCPKG
jgi:hypothetical protein